MKPPYTIPSMEEIQQEPLVGLSLVSLFAGAGGSCLGFRWAGFDPVWANDFVDAACATFKANFPETPIDHRDIRRIRSGEILRTLRVDPGEIDVLEGSPPSVPFSNTGRKEDGWGIVRPYSDTAQRTDNLFDEYARMIDGLQPKVFVAENVAALAQGVSIGHFKTIMEMFRSLGYVVEAKHLDAQWLGVPQQRRRLIFIGVRSDLEKQPAYPRPQQHRYTIGDALPDVRRVIYDSRGIHKIRIKEADRDACFSITVDAHHYILEIDKPSGDKTPMIRSVEKRTFSIPELKLISGFPSDFALTGNYKQQWERIGRAMPPPMMRAIAETIREKIFGLDANGDRIDRT